MSHLLTPELQLARARYEAANAAAKASIAAYDAAELAWWTSPTTELLGTLEHAFHELGNRVAASIEARRSWLDAERAATAVFAPLRLADIWQVAPFEDRIAFEESIPAPVVTREACATCGSATCCTICDGTGWDPETNPGMSGEACGACGGSGGR